MNASYIDSCNDISQKIAREFLLMATANYSVTRKEISHILALEESWC